MGVHTFDSLSRAGLLEIGDGYRAKNNELGGNGPIFLRSAYLQAQGFVLNDPERFISMPTERFGPKLSRVGDVVITTKGNSTGRIGRIRPAESGAVYSPHLSYWRSRSDRHIDQSFLYYWAASDNFRRQLAGMAHSTDMAPYLSLRDQLRIQIALPEIARQIEIGAILSALDDKIELNRRMNETLEASARALFRDWFVDFGPTRAKAEGRPAWLAPGLWSLFPDRLGDDGVPEEWIADTLAAIATLNPETWGTRDHPDVVSYVDLSNTKWGNIEKIEPYDWTDAPSRARRVLRPGDTIVGTVRPGNGSYAYVGESGLTGSTGFAVLRPKNERDQAIVWCAATSPDNIERLAHLADGGAYPAVRPEAVLRTEMQVPSSDILLAFAQVAAPLLEQVEANKIESRTLAATRDALLPKLMSGELRVREAEALAA